MTMAAQSPTTAAMIIELMMEGVSSVPPPPKIDVTNSETPFHCSADGELMGPERHRTWRIEPAAFSMPLPAARG